MSDRMAIFHDERVLDHDTGHGFFEAQASPYLDVAERHPENGERLRNMISVLRKGPIKDGLDWHGAAPASRAQLERFHDPAYLDALEAIPPNQARWFTSTTVFGPGSFEAISVATGLAVAAARHVWDGAGRRAYAAARPPGHHAQPAMADGYCFLNNIGVAIEELRAHGLNRAAVIDWDVHHGNGTQEGFYADPEVLTVSLHMDHGAWGQSHPQTGHADEVGTGAGRGANFNLPLPCGSGDAVYLAAFDRLVAPAVTAHRPEILFVAAGQDASQFDPNGRQLVTMAGFHQLGRRARALADQLCGGRLVLVQEGGYAMSYAAYCLHATLEGVLGRQASLDDPVAYLPDPIGYLEPALDAIARDRTRALGD